MDARYDVLGRDRWADDFETWFRVGHDDGGLIVSGEKMPVTELAANTVVAMGSPVLSLIARLDGMCGDHAWIANSDAAWFGDLVELGRRGSILRAGQGWEAVVELAREVASRTSWADRDLVLGVRRLPEQLRRATGSHRRAMRAAGTASRTSG